LNTENDVTSVENDVTSVVFSQVFLSIKKADKGSSAVMISFNHAVKYYFCTNNQKNCVINISTISLFLLEKKLCGCYLSQFQFQLGNRSPE
jgi:hypothetical protein